MKTEILKNYLLIGLFIEIGVFLFILFNIGNDLCPDESFCPIAFLLTFLIILGFAYIAVYIDKTFPNENQEKKSE